MKLHNSLYISNSCNDKYLEMLSGIFDDGSYWTKSVKETLLDSNEEGIIGNLVELDKVGNIIKISPTLVDNPEEYTIEIERQQLLDIINKWELLAKQKAPEIYLVLDEHGSIEVTDQKPKE